MFGLRKWLSKGSTAPPTRINTEMAESDQGDEEDEICVSATDSAFGVEEISKKIDFIAELPSEIALQILRMVNDVPSFAEFPCVSRTWCELSQDSEVWKTFFFARWKHLPVINPGYSLSGEEEGVELKCDATMEATEASGKGRKRDKASRIAARPEVPPIAHNQPAAPRQDDTSKLKSWKHLYHSHQILYSNWVSGNCTSQAFMGHQDAVYCVQFDARRIVSGSRDRTVKFWDIETLQCERTLTGHAGSVLCLQYDSRYLVTGSSDSTIIVWDFKTGEKLRVLSGHASPVLDVRFNEDLIVSCSKDCTIKVWSLENGKVLHTMEGHNAAVNAVHLNGDLVASASGDCLVKLWNARTGQHIRDFTGHSRGLACVQFSGKLIVSGSNDQTIKVWNAETGECIHTLTGHTQLVRTLCFDDERIVSGGYDQSIKVWDMKTGKLIRSVEGVHTSWVFHVQMDAFRIVSASQDRRIATWNFTTGCEELKDLSPRVVNR